MDTLDNLIFTNGAEGEPVKKAAKKAAKKTPKKENLKYTRLDLENKNILELRKICKKMGFPCLDKQQNIKNILNNQ